MHISQSIIVPVCCSYVRMYIYIGMNNYWWVYMGVYNVQSLSPSNAWDCVLKTAVRVYICICICMYNRCPNTYNSLTPPPPLTLAELCRQCQCRCLSHTHTHLVICCFSCPYLYTPVQSSTVLYNRLMTTWQSTARLQFQWQRLWRAAPPVCVRQATCDYPPCRWSN